MRNLLLFFSVSFCLLANSQTIFPEKKNQIDLLADTFVGTDGFDHVFYQKNNILFKKSTKNQLQYYNFLLGNPSHIDLTNPLRIVLFYENFNTFILLDNQLNEIQKTNLTDINNALVAKYVGISSQNNIWTFDSILQQLFLINLQSNQFQKIGNPMIENYKFCYSNFNYFYWTDQQNQLFSISIFGNVTAFGTIKSDQNFQIIEDKYLLYTLNNQPYLYNFINKKEYKIEIVEKSFDKISFKDQIFSIFTNKKIIHYKLLLP